MFVTPFYVVPLSGALRTCRLRWSRRSRPFAARLSLVSLEDPIFPRSPSSSSTTVRTVGLSSSFVILAILSFRRARSLKTARPTSFFVFAVMKDFDYCFAENGLTAYKLGQELESASFIKFLGDEKYKKLVKFVLHYIADMDIPIKRCVTERLADMRFMRADLV